ncbi:UNVERIFIED_CONTAM: hypothetical protein GTU68_031937 [Idotea baltica]|nr:hypothetical protein [Idotea baltica]
MKASIITIGDEILIGQTVDTNSAFIGKHLADLGIEVVEIMSISDTEEHILDSLTRAHKFADIVLVTGGLGPTKDDITKVTLAKYFKSEMYHVPEILARIEAYFKRRERTVLEEHKAMALMPQKCEVLINEKGTAAAMWFDIKDKITVSMPGVPYEMKDFMQRIILPRFKKRLGEEKVVHQHIFTAGKGETFIADKIKDIEANFPDYIKLAYLPNLGTVKLRLTANGTDEEVLETELKAYAEQIRIAIGETFVTFGESTIAAELGKVLKANNATLGTAESCTGGFVAHMITSVPGSSKYYEGSVITYSYDLKKSLLNVDKQTLETKGAVSEEIVEQMAKGAIQNLKVDYAIALSGIAGPGGGTPDKPVGTVWMAIASKAKVLSKKYELTIHRDINIPLSANLAMNDLRRFILQGN